MGAESPKLRRRSNLGQLTSSSYQVPFPALIGIRPHGSVRSQIEVDMTKDYVPRDTVARNKVGLICWALGRCVTVLRRACAVGRRHHAAKETKKFQKPISENREELEVVVGIVLSEERYSAWYTSLNAKPMILG